MGVIVIAAFRPKPGKAEELRAVVRDHLPILRAEDLVTEREVVVMEAEDGTILEVFEWKSPEAIDAAHRNDKVRELWVRYEACCEYVPPADVPETRNLFPGFRPLNPEDSA